LHLRVIEIGAEAERHRDGEAAVGIGRRVEIQRMLDAVDLLLERSNDGFADRRRRCARVATRDDDGGRHHLRKLAHRQQRQCDEPGDDDDDRQHRGKDRSIDEKPGDVHDGAVSGPCRPTPAADPSSSASV
jgi:hypothetical protein